MKKCPYCAESIKIDAVVCRYCGRDLIDPNYEYKTATIDRIESGMFFIPDKLQLGQIPPTDEEAKEFMWRDEGMRSVQRKLFDEFMRGWETVPLTHDGIILKKNHYYVDALHEYTTSISAGYECQLRRNKKAIKISITKKMLDQIIESAKEAAKDKYKQSNWGLLAGNNGVIQKEYLIEKHYVDEESFQISPFTAEEAIESIKKNDIALLGIYYSIPFGRALPSENAISNWSYPLPIMIISCQEEYHPEIGLFQMLDGTVIRGILDVYDHLADPGMQNGNRETQNKKEKMDSMAAIALLSTTAEMYTDRGYSRGWTGSSSDIEADYKKAIELDPNYAPAYHNLGQLYEKLDRFKEAEDAYKTAIKKDPNEASSYLFLAFIFEEQNRDKEAEDYYRLVVEKDPSDAGTYTCLGNLFFRQKRFKEAEDAYRKGIEIDPNDIHNYNPLGVILVEQERVKEAEEIFRKAIEIKPDYSETYFYFGSFLAIQKRYQEAESAYRKAIERNPYDAMAYFTLGLFLSNQERYQEAEEAYIKSIGYYSENDSNIPITCVNLGWILAKQMRYKEAEIYYRKAIENKPDYATAYFYLAWLFSEQEQYQQAEEAFNKAIEQNLDYIDAYFGLGWILSKQKRYKESEQAYRNVIRIDPNNANAYRTIGWLFSEQRMFQKAEEAYRLAMERDKNDGLPVYYMACLFGVRGDSDQACEWLRKAFNIDNKYYEMACSETDFDGIRETINYQALIKEFDGCDGN